MEEEEGVWGRRISLLGLSQSVLCGWWVLLPLLPAPAAEFLPMCVRGGGARMLEAGERCCCCCCCCCCCIVSFSISFMAAAACMLFIPGIAVPAMSRAAA